jgi:hypothetical protein
VLVFLAPETGGDFRTLIGAVRGSPGTFVRTSQDLNQAALDRSRLERYLSTIRGLNDTDPAKLKASGSAARAQPRDQGGRQMPRPNSRTAGALPHAGPGVADSQRRAQHLDRRGADLGSRRDLAMEASYTPQLSYGYYSPYIASVLDIARILDSFHIAQYQYIPALASQHGDKLALTLNTAPSFHNPKSVLVAALARRRTAAAAAAACGRPQGDLLREAHDARAAGRRCAAGVLDRLRARRVLEHDAAQTARPSNCRPRRCARKAATSSTRRGSGPPFSATACRHRCAAAGASIPTTVRAFA